MAAEAAAQVTPLLGACSDGPACSLLQIGAFNILLDCGWSQQFEVADLENLRIAIEEMRIDYVLLSHSDLEHVGALPMALSKFKLDAQVYGTWPVQKLGQLTLYEAYQNRCMEGEFTAFSLEDVDEAFNRVQPVKYSQNVVLRKGNEVLVCVPMAAGHRVGSTVWKIRKEATDLIYAVSFNLRKESTLFGSALHTEKSASVFITDSHCIHATDARLKDRETKLVKVVLDCLRAGGNVLMPCDATGRVLELLYMLGRHWDANRIGTYDLVFLAHVAFSTLEFARSMLEWMADLSGRKNNPFDFRHVFICRSLQQMDALGPNPKLVLATDATLSSGMAKELLLRWGGDPQNLVLFTQRAPTNTLAHTLMSTPPPIITQISIPVKVRLAGKELEEYKARKERANRLEQEAAQRHKQMQELQIFHNLQDEKEDRDDDVDEAGEQPMIGVAASAGAASGGAGAAASNVATPAMQRRMSIGGETAEANAERKRRRLEGLMKYTNPQHPMFTNVEAKFEYDDFGIKVNPDDFKDITSSSLLLRHRYGFPRPTPGAEADGPHTNGHDAADDHRQFMPESSLHRMYKAVESEEVPTKIELHRQSVQFTCQIQFIDFMGLSDSSSVKKLLQQTNPKRVVIIGGSELSTKQFAAAITPVVAEVFDPLPLTTVSCPLDSAFARVRLPVSYVQSSEFNRSYINASRAAVLGTTGGTSTDIDCWIAPVDHRLRVAHLGQADDGVPQVEVMPVQGDVAETEGGKDAEAVVPSPSKPLAFGSGLAITYGDISLDDLRTRLLEGNVRADFELGARGGLLVCRQSGACIRKVISDSGNESIFEVEGTPSDDFYALRRTLYSSFAFV